MLLLFSLHFVTRSESLPNGNSHDLTKHSLTVTSGKVQAPASHHLLAILNALTHTAFLQNYLLTETCLLRAESKGSAREILKVRRAGGIPDYINFRCGQRASIFLLPLHVTLWRVLSSLKILGSSMLRLGEKRKDRKLENSKGQFHML